MYLPVLVMDMICRPRRLSHCFSLCRQCQNGKFCHREGNQITKKERKSDQRISTLRDGTTGNLDEIWIPRQVAPAARVAKSDKSLAKQQAPGNIAELQLRLPRLFCFSDNGKRLSKTEVDEVMCTARCSRDMPRGSGGPTVSRAHE